MLSPGRTAEPMLQASGRRVSVLTPAAAELRRVSVARAAVYIWQAVDGIERKNLRDSWAAHRAFVLHVELLPFSKLCAWGLVALTFFERPCWCMQPEVIQDLGGGDPCGNELYPSFPISYLSVSQGYVLECLLVVMLVVDSSLLAFSQSSDRWQGHFQKRFVLLVVYILDVIVSLFTPAWAIRAAPYLRIGFGFAYSHSTRNSFTLILSTFPSVMNIFLLGFIFLLFFAWLGVILFPIDTNEGMQYFNGLGQGMWSLLILVTTANFPDVMMPAYREARAAFAFFAVFVILGVFFLVNMLTATIFSVHGQHKKKLEERMQSLQDDCVLEAYDVLRTSDGIAVSVIKELFCELNHYHDIRYIKADTADQLIADLDQDRDGVISREEFARIVEVLTKDARSKKSSRPLLERRFPQLKKSVAWQRFKKAVRHWCFDTLMDIFLVGTLVLTIIETWDNIMGRAEKKGKTDIDSSWDTFEHIFVVIFVAEALAKISALSFRRYWGETKNKFDFVVTLITGVVAFYVYLPNAFNDPTIIKVVAGLRALRVVRLLRKLPGCAQIVRTFIKSLPEGAAICSVLFCAMYLFSAVGCQLFGGVINTDPKNKYSKAIHDSAFGQSGYYPNNFNDMPSGMVLLFELLVVNNWFVLCEGFTAALGNGARGFFIAFYVFGVVICLNVVVAFILDSYMALQAEPEEEEEETEESEEEDPEEPGHDHPRTS